MARSVLLPLAEVVQIIKVQILACLGLSSKLDLRRWSIGHDGEATTFRLHLQHGLYARSMRIFKGPPIDDRPFGVNVGLA